ncbi:MAG: Vitamin transporter BtuB precursor [Pseudomonadota bacterium]
MAMAKFYLLSFIAPASLCVPSVLFAAQATNQKTEFDEVVVTASRIAQPMAQVGVSVDVLTREDLIQRNNTALADVLRTVPGINVSNSGGLGKATSIYIRGEDAFRTRLYIDGIAVSDTTSTQIAPRFDALLNQQLGRVEILKGPQALIYGADSGGVISVFTPEAKAAMEGDIAMEGGSFQTQNLSANLRGKSQSLDYFISSGLVQTEGFNARPDDTSNDNDGFRAANLHVKTRAHLNEQHSLGLVGRFNRSANEYDYCSDINYARVDSCDDKSISSAGRLDWHYAGNTLEQEFSLAHYTNQHDRYLNSQDVKNQSVSGGSDEAQYFAHYQFNTQVRSSLGLSAKHENYQEHKVAGNGAKADEARESYAVFSEWLINPIEAFSYSLGARWDSSPEYGAHESYRLAAAYVIPTAGPELKWRAATSTGFRLPSFYELYLNNSSPEAQKNFKEETSQGIETGLDARWQQLSLSATVFSNKIQNEIFYDSLNYSGYVQTEGESSSEGVELGGQWQMSSHLHLRMGYTHLETQQNSSDLAGSDAQRERLQRPENSYSLGAHLEFFAAAWQTDINYRSAFNQHAYGGSLMEDYSVVDIQTAWQFNSSDRIYMRVNNVLDEEYQEVKGYNSAQLNACVGIHWSF